MNSARHPGLDRLAELRQAFDRSFAEAPTHRMAAFHDLLDIRVAATPYVLRLAEIAGLFADVRITSVPTSAAGLLGIAAVRGAILPVYDLRVLIEHRADTPPRWVAIARGNSIGLAFDRFEGYMRVGEDAMVRPGGHEAAARYVREVVRIDGGVRPIISMTHVLESVTSRVRSGAREKE